MKTIWKYIIPLDKYITLQLPFDAKVLNFAMKGNQPFIWVLVETINYTVPSTFSLYETGEHVDYDIDLNEKYIGTVILPENSSVYHLFQSI